MTSPRDEGTGVATVPETRERARDGAAWNIAQRRSRLTRFFLVQRAHRRIQIPPWQTLYRQAGEEAGVGLHSHEHVSPSSVTVQGLETYHPQGQGEAPAGLQAHEAVRRHLAEALHHY